MNRTFDSTLLELGKMDPEIAEEIRFWIAERDPFKKSLIGAKLYEFLVKYILGYDISFHGEKRLPILSRFLVSFELLARVTEAGIKERFFRDHLNHVIRVFLLAHVMATQVKLLRLKKKDQRLLCAAALFHDIAIPLSESDSFFKMPLVALRDAYGFQIPFPEDASTIEGIKFIEDCLEFLGDYSITHQIDAHTVSPLNQYDHGPLSANELWKYVNKPKSFLEAILAVGMHNDVNVSVDLGEHPILGILIICDELQEWGRPLGLAGEIPLAKIDLNLSPNKLEATLDLSHIRSKSLSPLRLITSKTKSLSRITLKKTNLDLEVSIKLPRYQKIDYSYLESFLTWIFKDPNFQDAIHNEKLMNIFDLLYLHAGLPHFPSPADIIKNLSEGKVHFSGSEKYFSFMDNRRREVLFAPRHEEPISVKIFSDHDGTIKSKLTQKQHIKQEQYIETVGFVTELGSDIFSGLLLDSMALAFVSFVIFGLDKFDGEPFRPKSKYRGLYSNLRRMSTQTIKIKSSYLRPLYPSIELLRSSTKYFEFRTQNRDTESYNTRFGYILYDRPYIPPGDLERGIFMTQNKKKIKYKKN